MADAAPNLALALNLPPERAIEYFTAKGLRITASAQDMARGAHAGAFTVAGVLKAEVLADIQGALSDALESGLTYEGFLKGLMPKLKAKGWWGIPHDPGTGEVLQGRAMTPHRLRTVYQTNMQSSYMAGRYKAQLENANQRPYWQYVAILDSRTRPRHRELNGRIFRYDDPAWGVLYPSNGYNCRCRVKALDQAEMEAGGGAVSIGAGQLEEVEVDLGKKGGKVTVTGYRDPGTNKLFTPDPGFDTNPGAGYGRDIALAQRVQELPSREIRTQVWQALNNSQERLAAYKGWADRALAERRPGNSAQVLGFVGENVTDFMHAQLPEAQPIRIAAINEKRLVHADSAKHQVGGIALTNDQIMTLPGIIAQPDAVYFDATHGNFVLTRALDDGGVIFVALDAARDLKHVGRLDALVNAFRLAPGKDGAGRLANGKRFIKMGGEGR